MCAATELLLPASWSRCRFLLAASLAPSFGAAAPVSPRLPDNDGEVHRRQVHWVGDDGIVHTQRRPAMYDIKHQCHLVKTSGFAASITMVKLVDAAMASSLSVHVACIRLGETCVSEKSCQSIGPPAVSFIQVRTADAHPFKLR